MRVGVDLPKSTPRIVGVDLFCGVGGLTHGLVRGGIEIAAGFDIDPDCRYPFESNNSAAFIERDIGDLRAEEVRWHLKSADISLLAGCAPCQPFSTYSRQTRNINREGQWSLVSAFGRLVRELSPDLVTMENVPQLEKHQVFKQFLSNLNGYAKWWKILDCTTVGVPQTRKRLVLLASKLGGNSLDLSIESSSWRTVRDAIGNLPPIAAGDQLASDVLHKAPSLSGLNLARIKASRPGGTWRDWPIDLQAACHQRSTGATYPGVYGRMQWDLPAPTITTQFFGYGNGRFGHPEQDRAISIREAAMLQTFPATYTFTPKNAPIKFSQLGRLIGNAVPVRLGEVIGRSLVKHVWANYGGAT